MKRGSFCISALKAHPLLMNLEFAIIMCVLSVFPLKCVLANSNPTVRPMQLKASFILQTFPSF